MNFIQEADRDSEFAEELPKFIAGIKEIFQPWEIKEYIDGVERVGAPGHVCTDEQYETLRSCSSSFMLLLRVAWSYSRQPHMTNRQHPNSV